MKIMMIGDVYGEPGRATLAKLLPRLRDQHQIDFTVVNVENAAGGFGVTQQIAESVLDLGVDVMTKADIVSDLDAHQLAKDITKRIEAEMQYPGHIKVVVIRETRAVEVAK